VLELQDLVKHYRPADGDSVRAVDGISLTVARGELIALYGPSGSGKTTLLMLIAALLPPDSGTVRLDGRDITALSRHEAACYRRSELGFVRQSLDLIPGARTSDNAALKLFGDLGTREAYRRMGPLLERLGLGSRIEHRTEQLSMGERQRVMIARALSTDPKLVLADEPTGSLDTQSGREVLVLLSEICRERDASVLLVTHDLQAARYADRVQALRDGRLVNHEPGRERSRSLKDPPGVGAGEQRR
jgi:putative ABC transport system ATP-binding protein